MTTDKRQNGLVRGEIVDSWLQRRGSVVVLQVSPRPGSPELWVIEADPLAVEKGWLEDLGENLCHGNPVSAYGWWSTPDTFSAERVSLTA